MLRVLWKNNIKCDGKLCVNPKHNYSLSVVELHLITHKLCIEFRRNIKAGGRGNEREREGLLSFPSTVDDLTLNFMR